MSTVSMQCVFTLLLAEFVFTVHITFRLSPGPIEVTGIATSTKVWLSEEYLDSTIGSLYCRYIGNVSYILISTGK